MGKTFRSDAPRKKDYRKGKPSKEQRAEASAPLTGKRERRKHKDVR